MSKKSQRISAIPAATRRKWRREEAMARMIEGAVERRAYALEQAIAVNAHLGIYINPDALVLYAATIERYVTQGTAPKRPAKKARR